MANAVDLLTLLALPRLGRKTVHKLLPSLGSRPASPENICLMLETLRKTYPGVKVPQLKEVRAARKIAEELRLRCRRLAIRILVPGGKYFPARLETIPDPPVLLFARGHVECLTREKSVAIVGTREPSVFGFRAAKRLGAFFADRGWTVVSGLARGCDTAAHQGCLERGGKTAAFLAAVSFRALVWL